MEAGAALDRTANDIDSWAFRVHRDRDANASRVLRQRVDLLPRLAGIGRLVERRAVRTLGHRRATEPPPPKGAKAPRRSQHHMRHIEPALGGPRALRVFPTLEARARPASPAHADTASAAWLAAA